ncbi:glycosyltransferase family 4 protein [Paraburkholderia terrae]|uniref:glycosyltransferase family 4 protein n=1 Tax=Paraburkholderia terrae TaxID=311230 RepID=UPI00296B56C4|nr:glycosyltransferase family 4 protein [Paraburkholderia terrae]MDW3658047.1 glycosyltransferase family 4 protein [Paraburkholderia terrae]
MLFVIGHLGDYHVPRYEALMRLARRRGDEVSLVEVFGRSGFYSFPQTRRASFFEQRHECVTTLENDVSDAGGRWLNVFARLTAIIRRMEPDVVVTLGYDTPYSLWLCFVRRFTRPFGLIYMSDSKADDGPRSSVKEWLKRRLVRRFDAALVAGERHRDYAESLGIPRWRSRVGFDVIDVDQFSRRAAAAHATADDVRRVRDLPQRYVLCVSRFVARKNVDVVINAFARSRLADHAIELVLIGQGQDEPMLRTLVSQLELEKSVRFLDALPNGEMPAIYGLADFVVLASEFDQWGLCINEAFAASRTAIVTHTCGVARELVMNDTNGYVVEPGNAEMLAARMRTLALDDVLRERLSARARLSVEQWKPSTFASNLMELADCVLDSDQVISRAEHE